MSTRFLHVGFGNVVATDHIVAIVHTSSAPVKRMMREARDKQIAIDMTNGRKTKAVIVLNNGHIALSALLPETLTARADISTRQEPGRDADAAADSLTMRGKRGGE